MQKVVEMRDTLAEWLRRSAAICYRISSEACVRITQVSRYFLPRGFSTFSDEVHLFNEDLFWNLTREPSDTPRKAHIPCDEIPYETKIFRSRFLPGSSRDSGTISN